MTVKLQKNSIQNICLENMTKRFKHLLKLKFS